MVSHSSQKAPLAFTPARSLSVSGGYKPIVFRQSSLVRLRRIINSELCDEDDILHRRYTFDGQVNSELCYFPRHSTNVKYKLFRSLCSMVVILFGQHGEQV